MTGVNLFHSDEANTPTPPGTLEREINAHYDDPLSVIWTETARHLGMTVRRSSEVFASWNGKGELRIGRQEELDPDDCLAQMILHEICHRLVCDPVSRTEVDWGLDSASSHDMVFELATMRLQAALTRPHGLHIVLAVTTQWRPIYDSLPPDPLRGSDAAEVKLAQRGWERAQEREVKLHLQPALSTTAQIIACTKPFAPQGSLYHAFTGDDLG